MSWPVKRLDELMSIERGGSPRPIEQYITDDPNGLNWIKIGDATLSGKYIYETKEKIRPEGLKKSRFVEEGDFLLSNSMSFGRPYIMGTTGCIHDGWLVLKDTSGLLDKEYLYYALSSPVVFEQFDQLAAGSTVRNLNTRLVAGVTIPVPPKKEQQRIVGKLDAAFAALAEAQAHVERNRANARELFESYLNGVFEGKGDGWVERLLSDFIEVKHGYAYDGKYFEKGGPSAHPILLTPGNFSEEGKLVFTVKNTTRTSEASPDEYLFEINDLAIVMTDLSSKMKILGKAAFIRERGILHNQRIGKVISRDPDVLNEYLYYFFLTDAFLANIKLTATGTMVRHTAPKRITANKIPLPPNKRDQQRIVSQLDQLRKETATLEATYQQKLSELAGLKKAVLGAAFRGEL